MSLKRDLAAVIIGSAANKIVEGISHREAAKEIERINSLRFPEYEFKVVSAKKKKIMKMLSEGWKDALIDHDIGNVVLFPQEFLGKYVLLCKRTKRQRRCGFTQE